MEGNLSAFWCRPSLSHYRETCFRDLRKQLTGVEDPQQEGLARFGRFARVARRPGVNAARFFLFSGGRPLPASCYMLAGFTSRPVLPGPWSPTPWRLVRARVTSLHDCIVSMQALALPALSISQSPAHHRESIAMLDHGIANAASAS